MKSMTQLVLTASFSASLLAISAHAAESDVWDGAYLGLSGGFEYDKSQWQASSVGPNNAFGVDPTTATTKFDRNLGRLDGIIGWNMRVMPEWVAGAEAQFGGNLGNDRVKNGLPGIVYITKPSTDSITQAQGWSASFRGRFGYLLTSDMLAYGTAGLALRNFDIKGNCPANNGYASWCGAPETADVSKTYIGYNVGAGLETKVMNQWTVRAEYVYGDFSNKSFTLFNNSNQGADQIGGKVNLTSHVVTIGIAYHI
jgi:outer membrane immunogenic protein